MTKVIYVLFCVVISISLFFSISTEVNSASAEMDARGGPCEGKNEAERCVYGGSPGYCSDDWGNRFSPGGTFYVCVTEDWDGSDPDLRGLLYKQDVDKRLACETDSREDDRAAIGTGCTYENGIGDTVEGVCKRRRNSKAKDIINPGVIYCDPDITEDDEEAWGACYQDPVASGDRCIDLSKSPNEQRTGRCVQEGEDQMVCDTRYGGDREPGDTYTECGDTQCGTGQACVNNPADPNDEICLRETNTCGRAGSACDSEEACVINPSDPNAGGICQPKAGTEKTVPELPESGDNGSDNGFTRPEPQDITFRNPIEYETIPELLAGLIRSALGLLAAVTTVILVISGFKYMVAGSPSGVQSALGGIKNAVIGLIIIMGSFLLTEYVISALLS